MCHTHTPEVALAEGARRFGAGGGSPFVQLHFRSAFCSVREKRIPEYRRSGAPARSGLVPPFPPVTARPAVLVLSPQAPEGSRPALTGCFPGRGRRRLLLSLCRALGACSVSGQRVSERRRGAGPGKEEEENRSFPSRSPSCPDYPAWPGDIEDRLPPAARTGGRRQSPPLR